VQSVKADNTVNKIGGSHAADHAAVAQYWVSTISGVEWIHARDRLQFCRPQSRDAWYGDTSLRVHWRVQDNNAVDNALFFVNQNQQIAF